MKTLSLQLKMFIFSFFIVLFSILTSGLLMIHNISDAFEKEFGARAIAIARSVSQLPEIQSQVGVKDGAHVIQPIVERIRLATDVDYIVIFDMKGERYSHPSVSKIGTILEGTEDRQALSQHEYISKALGVQGFSIRAFVPIMDENGTKQVGVINVGILSPKWYQLIEEYRFDLFISLLWGIAIGLLGSMLIARHLKKQTLNLEPYEIARIVQERSSIMQAMDVGVLATNDQGHITFINHLARKYTHFFSEETTRFELFAGTWLAEGPLETYDSHRPLLLFDQMYLVRTFPIHVNDKNVGHVIMMTDQKDAHMLAEELTGIRVLVNTLRAQHHEYMNRLHSIAGLIQLNRNDQALRLIIDEISDEEEIIQQLRDEIHDYSIQGLLLGKYSRAKELGVSLSLDENSYLTDITNGFSSGDLVTIIGNLLDNAMEACAQQQQKDVELFMQCTKTSLFLEVQDSGTGIEGNPYQIFNYGFSTKKNKTDHGIGLALVKQLVDSNKGSIHISTEPTIGTTITITTGGTFINE
ncbi:MAG: sensor histidine kinase [Solibacillus sp.]